MTRDRKEGGHYAREYTEADVLEAFAEASVPVLTAPEVAEFVGCSPGTARTRLETLVEAEQLYRKEVGARAVVYVRLDRDASRRSGYGEWKQSLWEAPDTADQPDGSG